MSDSIPNTPQVIYSNSSDSSLVKVADPQYIIVGDEEVSIETMSNLIFEDIGGQEIINIDSISNGCSDDGNVGSVENSVLKD